MRSFTLLVVLSITAVTDATAQSQDPSAVVRIRNEAQQHSQIMENAFYLADVYGPRFTGSPNLTAAGNWLIERMKSYGLQDVHSENVDRPIDVGGGLKWSGRGWAFDRFSAEMLKPTYQALIGEPAMFSPSTPGPVQGQVLPLTLPPPGDRGVLNHFEEEYRGQLEGKILLISPMQTIQRPSPTDFHRYTDAELEELRNAKGEIPQPSTPRPTSPDAVMDPAMKRMLDMEDELFSFLTQEGVVALIQAAPGGGGTHFVLPPLGPPDPGSAPPPTIALEPEHYNRLYRLAKHNFPVQLEVNVHASMFPTGPFNVIADIPGTDKQNVIVVGAHLDSFQMATGATDNAANVAVVMEAARILETLKLRSRRTIRFAFWGAEEIDRQGSRDYVKKHIVERAAANPEDIQCYFNLDYGTGRIRGIYLQGHVALTSLFQQWLAPFAKDGGATVTAKVTNGSDQKSFNDVGTPGFSFIQDPVDYEARTHHTNMDTYDYLLPDDLKQSAVILASVLYEAANADQDLTDRGVR
ncbi:MAG TPA: M20/M25/M40 family metallo-hydrolase [Candidatus Aquilonibacter sp.]|nr:M20/M25/M40 family metallo-hydrolase [Candidatus Aquilonibacter sp.]